MLLQFMQCFTCLGYMFLWYLWLYSCNLTRSLQFYADQSSTLWFLFVFLTSCLNLVWLLHFYFSSVLPHMCIASMSNTFTYPLIQLSLQAYECALAQYLETNWPASWHLGRQLLLKGNRKKLKSNLLCNMISNWTELNVYVCVYYPFNCIWL